MLIISLAKARWFLLPVESASYKITGRPWLGDSLSFTLRCITVLNTSSWKWRFTSSYIWLASLRRLSYIVSRKPSISSFGFSLLLIILMVFSNLLIPSSAKYSQAYMDIMDDDPNTQSYNQFLHLGNAITPENKERYQDLFRRRKDFYRRYRDLSIFCLIGVYALSVIDAYVDASLSEFDISNDLSLRVQPAVINNGMSSNPLNSSSFGVQCLLNF